MPSQVRFIWDNSSIIKALNRIRLCPIYRSRLFPAGSGRPVYEWKTERDLTMDLLQDETTWMLGARKDGLVRRATAAEIVEDPKTRWVATAVWNSATKSPVRMLLRFLGRKLKADDSGKNEFERSGAQNSWKGSNDIPGYMRKQFISMYPYYFLLQELCGNLSPCAEENAQPNDGGDVHPDEPSRDPNGQHCLGPVKPHANRTSDIGQGPSDGLAPSPATNDNVEDKGKAREARKARKARNRQRKREKQEQRQHREQSPPLPQQSPPSPQQSHARRRTSPPPQDPAKLRKLRSPKRAFTAPPELSQPERKKSRYRISQDSDDDIEFVKHLFIAPPSATTLPPPNVAIDGMQKGRESVIKTPDSGCLQAQQKVVWVDSDSDHERETDGCLVIVDEDEMGDHQMDTHQIDEVEDQAMDQEMDKKTGEPLEEAEGCTYPTKGNSNGDCKTETEVNDEIQELKTDPSEPDIPMLSDNSKCQTNPFKSEEKSGDSESQYGATGSEARAACRQWVRAEFRSRITPDLHHRIKASRRKHDRQGCEEKLEVLIEVYRYMFENCPCDLLRKAMAGWVVCVEPHTTDKVLLGTLEIVVKAGGLFSTLALLNAESGRLDKSVCIDDRLPPSGQNDKARYRSGSGERLVSAFYVLNMLNRRFYSSLFHMWRQEHPLGEDWEPLVGGEP